MRRISKWYLATAAALLSAGLAGTCALQDTLAGILRTPEQVTGMVGQTFRTLFGV